MGFWGLSFGLGSARVWGLLGQGPECSLIARHELHAIRGRPACIAPYDSYDLLVLNGGGDP